MSCAISAGHVPRVCGPTERLNVDPLSYAPYAFYNWLNPLVAIAMAYAGGFAIYRLERPAGR